MRGIGITAALLVASAALAANWTIAGYQMVGIPVGESTITEANLMGMTADVDMTDGYSWKTGVVNVGFGGGVYFNSWIAFEGGLQIHTGYKNKAATIAGTSRIGSLPPSPFQWQEKEDNVTWKMVNLYLGPRFAYAVVPDFRVLGRGGLIYSVRSRLEYDAEWEAQAIPGVTADATHVGPYVGGGFNWFPFGPHVAITGLYTYNLLLEGNYDYSGILSGYDETWKQAPYLTLAHGIEYYF